MKHRFRFSQKAYGVISTALLVPLIANCAMMSTVIGSAKDSMKIAKGCPDVSNLDAIGKVDFVSEFTFDPQVAAQAKAGLIAASALNDIALGIDADLKTGCGGLAKDLGADGVFETGQAACEGALKALDATKLKLGGQVTIALEAKPPSCSASLSVVAECAGKCDASLKGGKAEVECQGGDISGACDADCTGKCALTGAATCAGTCNGSCEANFSGSCGGTCEGTCDGKKNAKGTCAGTCAGKCDTDASGVCGGECSGNCELSNSAKCEGTCTGKCSVDFREPVCPGTVVAPKLSAACQASCDAKANASLMCTPASVTVKVTGTKDIEGAAKLAAALETNLPRILKVAVSMADRMPTVLANAKSTIQGGIAAGQSVANARATASAHIGQCLLSPFEGAIQSVTKIQASIKVSVEVKASASGKAG